MIFDEFEREYLSVREKEGRLYSDDTVRRLPFVDGKEWAIRAHSALKLLQQLKNERCPSFVEIGCGNGWLTNYLQRELDVPATGIDINKTELDQAARISTSAQFVYGDIFSDELAKFRSGTIIFASSIQYFPDFQRLIDAFHGTIHIIDSPMYKSASDARQRSEAYFQAMNSKMKAFYFHHELSSLKKYDHQFLYRPNRLKNLLGYSPFPWIRIRKD